MRSKDEIMNHAQQVAGTYHTSDAEVQLITLEVLLDIRELLMPTTYHVAGPVEGNILNGMQPGPIAVPNSPEHTKKI